MDICWLNSWSLLGSMLWTPSTLAARARVLDSTRSQKNDPDDARSVAIVALRQNGLRVVTVEDHVAVLRMLARRHKQLASLKTQAASRLHAVLATLTPGGLGKEMVVRQASDLLRKVRPANMVEAERKRIAHQHLSEVRRLEKELQGSRARLEVAVEASGTSLTDLYGVGPMRRRTARWIHRRCDPVSHETSLCGIQRDRTHGGLVWAEETASAQSEREPDAQPCPASRRRHPIAVSQHGRQSLL